MQQIEIINNLAINREPKATSVANVKRTHDLAFAPRKQNVNRALYAHFRFRQE